MDNSTKKQLEETLFPQEEELDSPLLLISPTHWTFLGGIFLVFLALIFWAFFSTLAIRLEGDGLVFNPHHIFPVHPPSSGKVRSIEVFLGQEIQSEESLAVLDTGQSVLSTEEGTIVGIEVSVGETVSPTKPLFWVQSPLQSGEKQQIVGFFPEIQTEQILVGMAVEITLADANPAEYGRLQGRVASLIPLWTAEASGVFPTRHFMDTSGENIFTHLVVIDLLPDPHNASGYHWIAGKGTPFTIKPGTPCTLSVITENRKILSYLLP